MQKGIKEVYEEYKRKMEDFKKEEERIKKEKDTLKRTERLNRLNDRKMKTLIKYAKSFLNPDIKIKKKGR